MKKMILNKLFKEALTNNTFLVLFCWHSIETWPKYFSSFNPCLSLVSVATVTTKFKCSPNNKSGPIFLEFN